MRCKTYLNEWTVGGATVENADYNSSRRGSTQWSNRDRSILEEVSQKVEILSTDLDFISYPQGKKYLDVHDIGDENTWEFIEKGNYELFEPVWLFLEGIKNFIKRTKKAYRLTLHIEDTPEESEFRILIISLETVLENFDEKMLFIEQIGKIIDNITSEILILRGESFNEKLAPVIYTVGDIN